MSARNVLAQLKPVCQLHTFLELSFLGTVTHLLYSNSIQIAERHSVCHQKCQETSAKLGARARLVIRLVMEKEK